MKDWLRRVLGGGTKSPPPQRPVRKPAPGQAAHKPPAASPQGPPPPSSEQASDGSDGAIRVTSRESALAYLDRVQSKIARLAEEFAAGKLNRTQFQGLFTHYQNEIQTVRAWLDVAPESDEWKKAASEGKSVVIRRRHMARVLGYAIYENVSGIPIKTIGQFELDPALWVPMLSSYRSATQEIFGAGLRSTQIEGGRWLCFVGGELTTLMALFTTEPAGKQLETLEELHRLFETANRQHLRQQPIDPEVLVFPHVFFLGRSQ